jgi:hypothetical protein
MHSLSSGESPSVNARVTKVRKAQIEKLADMETKAHGRKVYPSDIIRQAIDEFFKNLPADVKAALMRSTL